MLRMIASHLPKPHPHLPSLSFSPPPLPLSLSLCLSNFPQNPRMNWCFSCLERALFRCRGAVSVWVFLLARVSGNGLVFRVMQSAVYAAFTCIFALGGSVVGTITGAIKGQTTETGFFRGSGIGAVTGAITALQLLESVVAGESLSKAALLCSLMNGKVFMEWVSPAVLKAYQWQVSTLETSYGETEDIYNISGAKGLPHSFIQKLPKSKFCSGTTPEAFDETGCTICLQDFKDGELTRGLPSCRHYFHMECVDQWLTLHGSCPMCRKDVCTDA